MRKFLATVGRVLVTAGLLILLFVAYQLWGTGIYQSRQQSDLRNQFDRTLATSADGSTTTTGPATTTTRLGDNPVVSTAPTTTTIPRQGPTNAAVTIPPNGDPVALINIPKIGVNQVVVEGVDVDDLRKGPGHYPATQLPGHEGTTAIAGHRTTYGAPFGDLDQLNPGDEIVLTTVQGRFVYKVTELKVVDPNDGSVLQNVPDPANPGRYQATITLTTCNPKYSAAERLVVLGALELPPGQDAPLPKADVSKEPGSTKIAGLGGQTKSRTPAIEWGILAAIIGLLWWFWFHRYPRWTTWIVGAVPFLATLFVFYVYLERLLPSNY
ncbi:MAG: class E sortase [Acidimicrobiia bacterium]